MPLSLLGRVAPVVSVGVRVRLTRQVFWAEKWHTPRHGGQKTTPAAGRE